tara:strand:- start:1426 stop:1746 length:321 start_codon:yes stop_codon:yes gene_type:complete
VGQKTKEKAKIPLDIHPPTCYNTRMKETKTITHYRELTQPAAYQALPAMVRATIANTERLQAEKALKKAKRAATRELRSRLKKEELELRLSEDEELAPCQYCGTFH